MKRGEESGIDPTAHSVAVLIDVGGVLCSDGLGVVSAAWSRRLGLPVRSVVTAIYAGSDEGVLIGRQDEEAWWQVVAARLGIGPELRNQLRDEIASAGSWDEELLACLRGLQGRARRAIVSNAWPHLRSRLAEQRLGDVADEIVLSCEVGYAKPDPRVYELALDRLGVTADESLLIDDTPDHVAAAVLAGLHGHVHTDCDSTLAAIERFVADANAARVDRGRT